MSDGKHFTLYSHVGGPNGWKVVLALEILGLTYETVYLDFKTGEQKAAGHTKFNPNGRIPTIIDHKNDDFVLWESNAILLYLVEKYDTDHKISVTDGNDKFTQLQWLYFQASGQGPYYGQLGWFTDYHPEKVPSAIERYTNETLRILGVLDSVLSKRTWLVADKLTIADLSFVPWNELALTRVLTEEHGYNIEKDFPALYKWHSAMMAMEPVRKTFETRKAVFAASKRKE
ncbi:predicted protein [Postia placenta Mad-698-R]|uniref:glutathione transferase n=1 Tax=Postia placenta MAD-698-R-SB12 TaxID=670580 RepID=A0A1X6MTS8_9APHY|nr:hypothetical protein POSPLADRAFT_1150348 [Postia placenta MAD-698-R-SB12]EED79275.1 predicted protein [Postia placenta Mad-698-R]OSX59593.1 hypothetical protein POSPLADRAFT_1150348 [Postia placenta MAD-698-R-SB12]